MEASRSLEFPPAVRRDILVSILLGFACLFVYNANRRSIGAGDTLPARYLPFGILHDGSVLLDPIRDATIEGHANPYWVQTGRNGHSVSLYPVVLPVLVAPLYLPAVVYLNARGWNPEHLRLEAVVMEKLTASLIAAAASSLLYLLLRRRSRPADALLLTLAFAFGTNTWMTGSQAFWQHGLAELLFVGLLLLLTAPCSTPRAAAAGALCGLIGGNRPPDVLLAGALGIYGLVWAGRRRAAWMAAGAAVPLGLVLVYNVAATGHLIGAYVIPQRPGFFRHDLLAGVAGLLFSPARGLFVFSPFLLLVPAGIRIALRHRDRDRTLALVIVFAAIVQVLFYAKADWRAGYSWGPRWLTDLLPLLLWLLPPALAALRPAGRIVFVLAICTSIAIQAIGAFWYTGASDGPIFAPRSGPGEMRAAWNPRNTPFVAELRHKRPGPGAEFANWRGHLRALEMIAAARVERSGRKNDLEAAARNAASRLRFHQQPAGFWLTSYTAAPRFENPRRENNTFLTSMVVDLLAPVAAEAGVGANLARARAYLRDQVEASGLVRYHGRPDGPTIPGLGCVITPDADDTALVWRIAGSDRPASLPHALSVLAQYRTSEGLYRTWLAPRERYQCLDPGKDPDPADVGIQMHVFLFLARADPPAARSLCGALQGAIGEDRLWVYYDRAPLVPLLRQSDLRRAGCPLRVPEGRVRVLAAGQEVWVSAGRLLDRLRSGEKSRSSSSETLDLLRLLSADGFSFVRRAPPLLYHNDFTARTPRFYWSEDFGYALWLRLYRESSLRDRGGPAHS